MTREDWLAGMAAAMIRNDRIRGVSRYAGVPVVLPSFPGRSTRSVLLGDIAQQEGNGAPVLLVSPLIATSLEVSIVLHWLLVRRTYGLYDTNRMTSIHNSEVMEMAGYVAPFKACVPSERLIDDITAVVNAYVNGAGEYPSQEVALVRRATQTTRLLKVVCSNHREPYILRMSQKQYDRGAPQCGVCAAYMTLA